MCWLFCNMERKPMFIDEFGLGGILEVSYAGDKISPNL